MYKLTEKSIGSVGEKYIATISDQNSLGNKLISAVDSWEFSAVVPYDTPDDRILQLTTGGLCGTQESQDWLMNFCDSILVEGDGLRFFVEDIYAKITDPYKSTAHIKRRVIMNSVLYSAPLTRGSAPIVIETIRQTSSYNLFLVFLKNPDEIHNYADIQDRLLYLLATAYDQESFIVGQPNRKRL